MPTSLSILFSIVPHTSTASLPRLRNLLPFILARKLLALTKLCWSSYCQWRTVRARAQAASCRETASTGHLRDDAPNSGKCGVGSNSRRSCRETEKSWNPSRQSMQLNKSRANKKSTQNENNHTTVKSNICRDTNGRSTTDSQQCKDERPLESSGVLVQGEDSSRRHSVPDRDPGDELQSMTATDQPKKIAERNSSESKSKKHWTNIYHKARVLIRITRYSIHNYTSYLCVRTYIACIQNGTEFGHF